MVTLCTVYYKIVYISLVWPTTEKIWMLLHNVANFIIQGQNFSMFDFENLLVKGVHLNSIFEN